MNHYYILILILLIYALSYWDGKEYNGERRWDWFRRCPLWKYISPVEYAFASPTDLEQLNPKVKRVYVMIPGETYVSLIWGIGLHGGRLSPFAERLHYVLPPIFFCIPLLRDILLWTGAVTYHSKRRPLDSIILELLQANRSVCYSPSLTRDQQYEYDIEQHQTAGVIETACPSDHLFTFARDECIQLVPIVTHGERRRYLIPTSFRRIQSFCELHIGYSFPMIFIRRRLKGAAVLNVLFGPILKCDSQYMNNDQLRESFAAVIASLTSSELGDDILKLR